MKKNISNQISQCAGKQERKVITYMYISRLEKYGKVDRSAMICEAIRLLYEKEK